MATYESLIRSAQLQELSIASPAAGADLSVTVPTGQTWRLETLFFKLVTSATVASRFPRIVITDASGNIVAQGGAPVAVAASNTVLFSAARLGPQMLAAVVNGGPYFVSTPDVWIPAGYSIKTATLNIDPADQFSLINGLVLQSTSA